MLFSAFACFPILLFFFFGIPLIFFQVFPSFWTLFIPFCCYRDTWNWTCCSWGRGGGNLIGHQNLFRNSDSTIPPPPSLPLPPRYGSCGVGERAIVWNKTSDSRLIDLQPYTQQPQDQSNHFYTNFIKFLAHIFYFLKTAFTLLYFSLSLLLDRVPISWLTASKSGELCSPPPPPS